MTPVPVAIQATPKADDEEITFLDDVDDLSSTEVMLGCGNDNPY
jgi:hypothetical protein